MARKQNNVGGWGWTPERRRRQSAAIQRWKPWRTGGVKKGETRSRMNALKHGARSAAAREVAAALTRIERAMTELDTEGEPET